MFYGALTGAIVSGDRAGLAVWLGLLAASGAHLALVLLLWRNRIACYPCLGIAALAWIATGIASKGFGLELLAMPAAFGVALLAISHARRLGLLDAQDQLLKLGQRVWAEPEPEAGQAAGAARLVVYGWKTCPYCAFFKDVVRPLIEEEFGPALVIEERDAAKLKIIAPVFLINGVTRITLAAVPTEEMHERDSAAIHGALDPAVGRASQDGFQVIGLDRYRDRLANPGMKKH